jgi:hypothetical protein
MPKNWAPGAQKLGTGDLGTGPPATPILSRAICFGSNKSAGSGPELLAVDVLILGIRFH